MFDTSELVKIEYITISFAVFFMLLGYKYNSKTLGFVVAFECLLTTFMSRHESMLYWSAQYSEERQQIAWQLYNTGIVLVQSIVIIIVYLLKSSIILSAYFLNLVINSASFAIGLLIVTYPKSEHLLTSQSIIDDKIYWYIYSLSMLIISIGLIKNGSRNGGGLSANDFSSDNFVDFGWQNNKLAQIFVGIKRRILVEKK